MTRLIDALQRAQLENARRLEQAQCRAAQLKGLAMKTLMMIAAILFYLGISVGHWLPRFLQ